MCMTMFVRHPKKKIVQIYLILLAYGKVSRFITISHNKEYIEQDKYNSNSNN
jgi:hypothetical protein